MPSLIKVSLASPLSPHLYPLPLRERARVRGISSPLEGEGLGMRGISSPLEGEG